MGLESAGSECWGRGYVGMVRCWCDSLVGWRMWWSGIKKPIEHDQIIPVATNAEDSKQGDELVLFKPTPHEPATKKLRAS